MNHTDALCCSIQHQLFGQIDQHETNLWTLTNPSGMQVSIMDFGAIVTSLSLSDQYDRKIECVLGFNQAESYATPLYRAHNPHLGGLIGRHAGRLSFAKAPLNNQLLQLNANLGEHHIHGGYYGFDQQWWQCVEQQADQHSASITLYRLSLDGEEGYPGNLHVWVRYSLTQHNEFWVDIRACCDQDTLFNPTQHSYFNLSYQDTTINQHQLWLNTRHVIATDDQMMPTGQIAVLPSHLDFQKKHIIGHAIIDAAFILPESTKPLLADVAVLSAQDTGITLKVKTDAPVLVVYNSQHLPTCYINNRRSLLPFAAMCFEPQGYSDAPNHPIFPNNLLKANTPFQRCIGYIFHVSK